MNQAVKRTLLKALTFLVAVVFAASSFAADYQSAAACWASQKQMVEEAQKWDRAWMDCSSGTANGTIYNCRGLTGDRYLAASKPLSQRRDQASTQAREIERICEQMDRNERSVADNERRRKQEEQARLNEQFRKQQESQSQAQSIDSNRAASVNRFLQYQQQSQQAASSLKRQRSQAAGAAMLGLLGSIFKGNSSSDDDDDDYDEPVRPLARNSDANQVAAQRAAQLQAAEEARQKQERDASIRQDDATYKRLVEQIRVAKNSASDVVAFVGNPFDTTAKAVSNGISSVIMDGVVQGAIPGSTPISDPRFDRIVEVTESAGSKGMSGNPFAKEFSSKVMSGVTGIEGRALGAAETTATQIASFEARTSQASSSPRSDYRPMTPLPNGTGGAPQTNYPIANPFDDSRPSASPNDRYYDASTRSFYEIPKGHVMYRESSSRTLLVLPRERVPATAGDRVDLGERGCTADGLGIVTAICESIRYKPANPFSN